MEDLSVHNRHIDPVRYQHLGQSVPISASEMETNSQSNSNVLDNTGNSELRRSKRLRLKESSLDSMYNRRCGQCEYKYEQEHSKPETNFIIGAV